MGELLDFYKGMDLSFLQQCQEEGMVLRDFDGAPRDPLQLAKALLLPRNLRST